MLDLSGVMMAGVVFGVGLTLAGGTLVSAGLTLQKRAHMTINRNGSGSVYRMVMWWIGNLALGCGELLNFCAFGFAPASLVVPLGGWSVAVAGFLAIKVLGEAVTRQRVVGICLCIGGTMLLTTVSPLTDSEPVVLTDADLLFEHFGQPSIVLFLVTEIAVLLTMILITSFTNIGSLSSLVYLTICSLSEGIGIVAAKCGAALLKLTIKEKVPTYLGLFFQVMSVLAATLPLQVVYLNKAMALFGNSEVVPRHYVLFTFTACLGSQVVFGELNGLHTLSVPFFLAIITTSYGVLKVAGPTKTETHKFSSLPP